MDLDKKNEFEDEESKSFDDLQNNFQSVISDLINDKSLDAFRAEYEKLYDALQQSHNNNQTLIEKCRQLNEEINTNSSKVQAALKFSHDDQHTISILRNEFERAWKNVELLHEKENKSREIVLALKTELGNLYELAEQGNIYAYSQEASMQSNSDQISSFQKQIQAQAAEIKQLTNDIKKAKEELNENLRVTDELKRQETEFEASIKEEAQNLVDCDEACQKYAEELSVVKKRNKEIADSMSSVFLDERKEAIRKLEENLHDLELTKHEETATRTNLRNKIGELEKVLEIRRRTRGKTQDEYERMVSIIEAKDAKIDAGRAELKEIQAEREKLIKMSQESQREKQELEKQVTTTRHAITEGKNEMFACNARFWQEDSEKKAVARSVNLQRRQNEIELNKVHDAKVETEIAISDLSGCEIDLSIIKKEYFEMLARAHLLQVEIDDSVAETISNNTNATQVLIELQASEQKKEQLEKDYQQIIRQTEKRNTAIKEMRDHHEVDARRFEEIATESNDIIADLKFLKLNVIQMKETTTKTDNQCMQLMYDLRTCEQQSEKFTELIAELKNQLAELHVQMNEVEMKQQMDEHLLSQSITHASILSKEMANIDGTIKYCQAEIDRRDMQSKALRAQIQILTDTIVNKGSHFDALLRNIKNSEQELVREAEKMNILSEKALRMGQVSKEFYRTQKSLIVSRAQIKALEEESQIPIGIHRWTLLDSVNPEMSNLIRIRISLSDQICAMIAKNQRLCVSKDSLKHRTDRMIDIASKSKCDDYSRAIQIFDSKYRSKSKQLAQLVEQTEDQKSITDTWRAKMQETQKALIYEKEQIFITKQKEHAVSASMRIHEPMHFSAAQSPRSIVPRLKIIAPNPMLIQNHSIKVISSRPIPTQAAILPPLKPVVPQSART